MGTTIDLTGKVFGRLTAIKQENNRKNGKLVWECLCSCGNKKSVVGQSLRKGLTTSCGCYKDEVKSNSRVRHTYIGKKFGKLLVTAKSELKDKYSCICECGNTTEVLSQRLIKGLTTSCGCLVKSMDKYIDMRRNMLVVKKILKKGSNRNRKLICKCDCGNTAVVETGNFLSGNIKSCGCLGETKRAHVKYLGVKYNKLTVIGGSSFKNKDGAYKLKCECDCGNITYVAARDLRDNGTKSCGCLAGNSSCGEKEVAQFIEELGFAVQDNVRGLLRNKKKEIDIFIPSKNIGIEYNGLRWHSTEIKPANKFNIRDKSIEAVDAGIDLIHIREDQWLEEKDKVKSLLKARLGIFENRTGARKTYKKKIGELTYRQMNKYHHLQGHRPAKHRRGLFLKDTDELVAVIGYDDKGELIRYTVKSGWQVQGALSKLMKGEDIKFSFCDITFFNGNSYAKAGFTYDYTSAPNYRYCKQQTTVSRNSMMKHKLENKLDIFDETMTEVKNCAANGWYQIFDCGNAKYVLN